MEVASSLVISRPVVNYRCRFPRKYPAFSLIHANHHCHSSTGLVSAAAIHGVSSDPGAEVQLTWQIAVGALAGVTPFVVAGFEFTKRIVAQKNCEICQGSGLVLRDRKYYIRCPNCGGFLPWQSWKRFFSG